MDRTELRQKWVEALRSGEYKKTQYRLKRGENYYCCLGVAAVVAGEEFEKDDFTGWLCLRDGRVLCNQFLPERVIEAYGLRSEGGRFLKPITFSGYEYKSLAEVNDHSGWTFGQIADLIENQPEIVFKD